VIKIAKQAIAVAAILLVSACDAQEKKMAPVAKNPRAEQKAAAPSGNSVERPEVKTGQAEMERKTAAVMRRDPFRPFTLTARTNVRRRDNLSPLERYELGQLKLVGIVWDIKTPTALVEDTAGLGYTVKVGTLIGTNDGKIKAIHRNEVVVEEFYSDAQGARKPRDMVIKLLTE
jgi:type IV pilus assembly protein PilP